VWRFGGSFEGLQPNSMWWKNASSLGETQGADLEKPH